MNLQSTVLPLHLKIYILLAHKQSYTFELHLFFNGEGQQSF
jgi:hypothetical protein